VTGIVVQPIRFTDGVAATRDFLTVLGLQVRLESEGGDWVDMASAGGRVALHSAESSVTGATHGETRLSFETDDADALAAQLTAAGVDAVTVYDEAYGRALDCRDSLGDTITINEQADDLYGYRLLDTSAETGPAQLRVSPVRFTDPQGPMVHWLEALGLQRIGAPNGFFVTYAADSGDHGYVGLHHVYSDDLPVVAGPAAVQLTFTTDEPLDAVADRLRAAGYDDASVTREDFGGMLSVTDPDGCLVQVGELTHRA